MEPALRPRAEHLPARPVARHGTAQPRLHLTPPGSHTAGPICPRHPGSHSHDHPAVDTYGHAEMRMLRPRTLLCTGLDIINDCDRQVQPYRHNHARCRLQVLTVTQVCTRPFTGHPDRCAARSVEQSLAVRDMCAGNVKQVRFCKLTEGRLLAAGLMVQSCRSEGDFGSGEVPTRAWSS